ncbi:MULTISPECIES: DMT family transporter [Streptosporangium]|uniref:Drug/metabolite transporter (DMT)-like permease n=1 Tax=Streptosporangium brasiliense TaxID=47480 RepID=A0ABT9RKN8_9ACTN|nr:DMT family transporter [Streptosporangium brasiliense]MDP9869868.1 drug/metabolite transporter (DMT)-like permease [Streptosporangium brasiliense]
MNGRGGRGRLIWQSAGLVVLLASTWLIVEASLRDASTAIVSGGRTGFTVLGLLALTWWSPAGAAPVTKDTRDTGYRWWQVVLLALTGVTAYTVLSTIAISLAGPALPALALSLTPAVVLIAESVLLRTWPAPRTIAGTVIAVAGAAIYAIPRLAGTLGDDVALGSLVALAAMFSMAFYGLYFSRTNRGYQGAMAPRILPIFAVGTIPLAAWAAADVAAGERISWSALGMLVMLGIVIYVPAYLLQHRILLTGGPSYSALLGLAVPPLVGAGSALLQLVGAPAPMQIVGMGLTLAGMALVIRSKLTRTDEDRPARVTLSRPSDA